MVVRIIIGCGHCLGINALVKLLTRIIFVCIIAIAVVACSSGGTSRHYGYHKVERGDTLYSISWRYGLDANQLARWNGIARPYTIYPGQRLRLSPTGVTSKSYAKKSKSQSTKTTRKVVSAQAPGNWRWPVKGKIIKKFNAQNNGIDIKAKEGTIINAASNGKVVYAGSGLRGYGNLLIIKHNASYFSAYAHSRRLLVKEGAQVKVGEKIAELGSTGTDQAKLHFEIRKDGNPVDPLKYLPR